MPELTIALAAGALLHIAGLVVLWRAARPAPDESDTAVVYARTKADLTAAITRLASAHEAWAEAAERTTGRHAGGGDRG